MKATVVPNAIPVVHSVRTDLPLEFLTISVPNDWDDVKKIHKKVLSYDGRKFTFRGWNSDTHECYFSRSTRAGDIEPIATFVRK